MDVILCLPTYVRPDLACRCIDSAFAGTLPPWLVYVVDNWGRFAHPDRRVHVINPPGNRGYAGSLNLLHQLTRWCSRDGSDRDAPYRVLYTNDDIEFEADSIRRAVELSDQHPFVSLCAFGCMVIREEVWQKVGDVDPNYYPVYFDDNDYTYRMKLAGIEPHFLTGDSDAVRHAGSASLHALGADHRRAHDAAFLECQAYYERKWGGPVGAEKFTVPFGGA